MSSETEYLIIEDIKDETGKWENKLWEELIVYFPFTAILESHTSKKRTIIHMHHHHHHWHDNPL